MTAAMTPEVVVIGLDVGDGTLIREWASSGHLPCIHDLLEQGSWSWLSSPARDLHVAAWPSIYTGSPPGEHGVYFTFQTHAGLQGWRKFYRGVYRRPTFWNLLQTEGVPCTVFDAPYVHPEEGPAATQIFDWGTWAHHWRTSSKPRRLLRRLERACGPYPLGLEALDLGLGAQDGHEISQRLVRSVGVKGAAAVWLMREVRSDLFFVTFGETHPAAHYCYPTEGDPLVHSDLLNVYRAVDQAIARVLKEAGPEARVFLISGDGARANYGGWHLLPGVLRRLGLLVEHTADEPEGEDLESEDQPGFRIKDPVRLLRDALPKDFRKRLARRLPGWLRHRLAQRVDTAAIDWQRTRAYCLPSDLEGYIRVNLKGREPQGIVEPGAEYERVCRNLTSQLEDLRDPCTGKRAVRRVVPVDQSYPGPGRDQLPDLVVVWEPSLGQISSLEGASFGIVRAEPTDARPGTHSPRGFLLRAGPGSDGPTHEGRVEDLAPELLAHFGASVPDYMKSAAGDSAREAEAMT